MRNVRSSILLLLALFLMAGTVLAQDPGNRDTVRVAHVQTNAGQVVGVPVTLYNDENLGGYSLGIKWDSDDITMDSTSWIGTRMDWHLEMFDLRDNTARVVLEGAIDTQAKHPITPGDSLLFTMWFTVAAGAADQYVTLDSTFVPPAGDFILSIASGGSITPEFHKGEIKIGNPQPPPVIVLSKSSFSFSATAGGTNPVSQIQQITNGGGQTLIWSATKAASWLYLTPSGGTAPSTMSVAVGITGLMPGTYSDVVTISAAGATNSPQTFTVTLYLAVPPPTIQVAPTSFYFKAQQAAGNPAGQTFNITNIGMGTLNWTATETATWMTLSSYSGTAPSTVTINVDNAGLSVGVYRDSIMISDPTATNSPQWVYVTFEIFSEFPVILPEPISILAIGSATQDPYPHTLLIKNSGAGVLNWTLTKQKNWLTVAPTSGTATDGSPSEVTLNFNHLLVDYGTSRDTIVISSASAINSPVKVPVVFWKQEEPVMLTVSKHIFLFEDYECGSYPGPGPDSFIVNPGPGQSITWTSTHTADWLVVSPSSGTQNTKVRLTVSPEGLAPGEYMDFVVISSDYTFNQSVEVTVVFTVLETPEAKEMALTDDSLFYVYNYTQVKSFDQDVWVYADPGGCVDWQATADVSWLTPMPASGSTPQSVTIRSDAVGLSLGRHVGKVRFRADGIINSPKDLEVELWVYTFGDANGDGRINIRDVVYIIMYIFQDGPEPVPFFWVGDVNCSRTINLSDAIGIIDWMFHIGPPPCLWEGM